MICQIDSQVFPDRILVGEESFGEQITNDDRRGLASLKTIYFAGSATLALRYGPSVHHSFCYAHLK